MASIFGSRADLIEEIIKAAGINLPKSTSEGQSEETNDDAPAASEPLSTKDAIDKAVFESLVVKRLVNSSLLGTDTEISDESAHSWERFNICNRRRQCHTTGTHGCILLL